MQKCLKIDIDCAACAQKVEDAISKLDGVESARVDFIMGKLTINAPEGQMDDIVKKAKTAARRIEPDCEIYM